MLASLGLSFALAAPAQVEPLPFTTEYDGPPTCPASGWNDRLRAALGREDVDPTRVVAVRVTVDEQSGAWRADLQVEHRDGRSERSLEGDSCASVLDAASFVVVTAMSAEPPGLVPPLTPEVEPLIPAPEPVPSIDTPRLAPAPTVAVAPGPAELRATAAPTQPSPATRIDFTAAVGVDALALPGTGAAIRVGLDVGRRIWRVGVVGGYHTPRVAVSAVDPDARGRFDLWSLGPRGCAVPGVRRWQFRICGGLELGQIRGRGEGSAVRDPERATRLWVAPAGLAGVAFWPAERVGVGLQLNAAVPLRRPRFFVEGLAEPIHQVGPVMLRGLVAVTLRLW